MLTHTVAQVNTTLQQQNQTYPSTLGGIVQIAFATFDSEVILWTESTGALEVEQINAPISDEYLESYVDGATVTFHDPSNNILQSLNRLMFYMGAHVAQVKDKAFFETYIDPGLDVNTTITGLLDTQEEVYKTDLIWFLAAAVIEGVCILLVLITYNGWWRLGRLVSLSPIEIAAVRNPPSLKQRRTNNSIGF